MANRTILINSSRPGSGLRRGLMLICGSLALGLGLLGIVLPLLPTTPFLVLAGFCYSRSSRRLYNWLHGNPLFGEYLRRYVNKEGIPLRVKVITIALLWLSILISAFLLIHGQQWFIRIILLFIGIGVSIHLLLIRTCDGGSKYPPPV
ncbi:MAG: YbaN family protein [Candidatus Cloacimonetes bacterium]|nr:YbaN family protein [Candidatus Cloacimonadota bacterium]